MVVTSTEFALLCVVVLMCGCCRSWKGKVELRCCLALHSSNSVVEIEGPSGCSSADTTSFLIQLTFACDPRATQSFTLQLNPSQPTPPTPTPTPRNMASSPSPSPPEAQLDEDDTAADLPLTMAASVVLEQLPKDAHKALEIAGEIGVAKGRVFTLVFCKLACHVVSCCVIVTLHEPGTNAYLPSCPSSSPTSTTIHLHLSNPTPTPHPIQSNPISSHPIPPHPIQPNPTHPIPST